MLPAVATDVVETHPEHQVEQAYVTRAYELLDKGLAAVEVTYQTYEEGNRATSYALRRALELLRNSRGSGQLVFGRIDRPGDQPLYIGRRRVHDETKDLVVASWHAPAAQVFYEAGPADSRGLDLKRVFVEQDRLVSRVIDEITATAAADVSAGQLDVPSLLSDALLMELDRSRDGVMREVVATIQAEQFRIIRAPRDGVLVVQGGPGTGKTVVGLHRAAWHAFNDAELRRAGILVVAPSTAFLSYMSGVLPSLDASDVLQVDLGSLYAGEALPSGIDTQAAARVKGSGAMVTVLSRALSARRGWEGEGLEFSLGGARAALTEDQVRALVADAASRDLPHNQTRDVLRRLLSAAAFRAHSEAQAAAGRAVIATEPAIRRLSTFTNALDRMWPTFTPEELLRSLYGTQTWLVNATTGVLSADERASLFRDPQPGIDDEPWTQADLFCLDELSFLLNGDGRTYGHVVVDEAQDLSPMHARALARRCPNGSFTLLGDLAQATGPWIRDNWHELTQYLGDDSPSIEELTIGYRVPGPVVDLAARLLPTIAPSLAAPRSIRRGLGEPSVHLGPDDGSSGVVERATLLAEADVNAGLTTAVVVADAAFADVLAQIRQGLPDAGDGSVEDFSQQLTVIPVSLVKGLEFDSVVLLEPSAIVASGTDGLRHLYVAMTRCTQVLRLVDGADLPLALDHRQPDPVTRGVSREEAVLPGAPGPADEATPTLHELIEQLDDGDRALVTAVVLRLMEGRDV
ncbi:AAA family ATPase [Modestobacter sp. KNN46-3]|jgi:DNA helicase IV|uniref:HelD family protein n=1 Tax=Modestobacter sp. KNN46-3 TaxID=2711218 RepID=UPI0013E0926C|nr:AAA family ATPase [Modestobacter sp. KNN46-3]